MVSLLKTYYKSIIGQTEWSFGLWKISSEKDLAICALHSVPREFLGEFGRLVEWLKKNYTILHPNKITEYKNSPERYTSGPYLVLTFDDGLQNNLGAAEVLATHGVSAIFFIVPEFVESTASEDYYLRNIRPKPDYSIDKSKEDRSAMSWDDIKRLLDLGQVIGSHSLTHLMHGQMQHDAYEKEIIESKKVLESKLGVEIQHFASPNNTLFSTNADMCALIQKHYTWHHTTLPGKQSNENLSRGYLYRRNIEVHWPRSIVKFSLGRFDLRRWQKRRDALALLLQHPRQ